MRVFCISSCLIVMVNSFCSASETTTELATVAACVKRRSIIGQPTRPIAIPTKTRRATDPYYDSSNNSTPTSYLAVPSPVTSVGSLNSISPCSAPNSRNSSPDSRNSDEDKGSRFSFSFDITSASAGFHYCHPYSHRGSH